MNGLTSALSSALSALSLPRPAAASDAPPDSAHPAPSSSPPASPPAPTIPNGFTLACALSSLPVNARLCLSLHSRALLLFRLPRSSSSSSSHSPASPSNVVPSDLSVLYAIDSICYHMGGPLTDGDIEELLGQPHIVCPWHRFRISIPSGEGAYQVAKGQWKSKGRRQRTHDVLVIDDAVYIKVGSSADGKVESDTYGDLPISQAEVEERERKRKAGGGYQAKGPSGMHRGSAY